MPKKLSTSKTDFTQEFNLINKKLNLLIDKQVNPKKTWVKVGIVQDLTGWNKNWLYKARKNHLVETRITETGSLEYCLESLNSMFIKKKIR